MKADPNKSIFINCPYDEAYSSLFDALVLTTVCCGFVPRSAREVRTLTEPRIFRILSAVFESRYSVHDLSRSKGEGEEGYARLNMPFELGIAIARWHMTRGTAQQHDWLLLVPSGYNHQRFLSDLSGFDPSPYDGTVETLVPQIMLWLDEDPNTTRSANAEQVLEAIPRFRLRRQKLEVDWSGRVPWRRLIELAEEIAATL